MSTALDPETNQESGPKKAPKQILRSEIKEGLEALERSAVPLFLSGLSAGLDVGFSLLLMAVMWTQCHGSLPEPVVHGLVANMYSVGFIFVVIGRSELFTEQTTLAVMPVLSREASLVSLGRLWGLVYSSNLLGAAAFAGLAVLAAPVLGIIDPAAFRDIGQRMAVKPPETILFSAILAGWLMGLLSWLVAAGRDTISQIILVWLITTAIGFLGLHHVVLGSVEVFAAAFAGQGVGPSDVGRFLLWTTLGNILGGSLFVALIKYGHARAEALPG